MTIYKGVVGLRTGVAVPERAHAFVWTQVGGAPALWVVPSAAAPVLILLLLDALLRVVTGQWGHA